MNCQILRRANELLAEMSLKDKIGQLTQIGFNVKDIDGVKKLIRERHPGSMIVGNTQFAGNEDGQGRTTLSLLNEIQEFAMREMGVPMLFGKDVIHGHKTVYPIPLAMAASFNEDFIKTAYEYIRIEAVNDGLHWAFTPMLDVSHDPRWGRIIESPGEDPYIGERFSKAVVNGLQGNDISEKRTMLACAKHYIAYSLAEGGRDYHRAEVSDYNLRNYYLKPFRAAIKAGVKTVMSSFNEVSGQPVTSSHYLLTDVLRGELGFEGFVVSDYASIKQLIGQGVASNKKDCARLAINAGLDMDMASYYYSDYLEELVKDGSVDESTIDDSVRRILCVKLEKGLFEHPSVTPIAVDRREHQSFAREFAGECMVLLKNKNSVLPLKKESNVAVYGPLKDEKRAILGSWTIDFDIERSVSVIDGIRNVCCGDVVTSALPEEMRFRSQFCDAVILVLGESNAVTGEARSLSNIEMSDAQKEYVKSAHRLGKPVIGVLCYGRPIALESIEPYFDAIIYSWHCGSETGNAAADILFGDVNPSGKLTATMPRVVGQVPIYYNSGRVSMDVNGYYGPMYDTTTVRNYEDCRSDPMYPFGYGLSYTEFEYSEPAGEINAISLEAINRGEQFIISVNIRNTGKTDGKETAQCYIRDCCASMSRPIRELKDFKKVFIKAGKTVTVEFTLGKEELAFYNANGEFCVEKGDFDVFVGKNCLDVQKLKISVI